MEWLKSEWLKLTLGAIYTILTSSVLLAIGGVANKINNKVDRTEFNQKIELVNKDFVPIKEDISRLREMDIKLEQADKDTRSEYLKEIQLLRRDILEIWKSKN